MNKTTFTRLIQNSLSISDADMQALEQVVQAFPYCHVAHMLLAKASHDKASMLAPQRLRKAAIHAPSRSILKKLIESVPQTERQLAYSKVLNSENGDDENIATAAVHALVPEYQEEIEDLLENDFPESLTFPQEQDGNSTAEAQILPITASAERNENINSEALEIEEEFIQSPPEVLIPEEATETFTSLSSQEYTDGERFTTTATSLSVPENGVSTQELPGIEAEDFAFAPVAEAQGLLPQEQENPGTQIPTNDLPAENIEPRISDDEKIHKISEETPEEITETATGVNNITGATEAPTIAITPDTEEALLAHPEELTLEEPVASLAFREAADAKISASVDQLYADDLIRSIYRESELGYAMSSSRLGECLQIKSDLTTEIPFHFQPELLVEYQLSEATKAKTGQKAIIAQQDLINDFLKQASKGRNRINQAAKAEEQEDLSSKSTKLGKSLVSENLAQIFAMQGKNKKAIKIYQQLMLKIPEKKDYFAAQIVKLQNNAS